MVGYLDMADEAENVQYRVTPRRVWKTRLYMDMNAACLAIPKQRSVCLPSMVQNTKFVPADDAHKLSEDLDTFLI
jgi:hypothetical protein